MTALDARGTVQVASGTVELDLRLDRGAIVGLVGPNGVGKSAIVATLVGLLTLRSGQIVVDGTTVDDARRALPPHQRGLGWVPQHVVLLPRRRPLAQVAAFAGRSRARMPWRDPRVVLDALGLDPDDQRRPEQMSGGQRQRIAVARCLTSGSIALLDEPFSAQDGAGAEAIHRTLRQFVDDGGAALVVAHRPQDAYAVADELVVLEAGAVVQRGAPADLAAQPATPYVARVVGATVLEGMVSPDGTLTGDWGMLVVGDDAPVGPAVAVVHPSAVTIHPSQPAPASARNVIAAVVSGLSDSESGVQVRLDGSPPLVAALTHAAAGALELRVGDRVWATVKASQVDVRPRAGSDGRRAPRPSVDPR